MLSRDIGPGQDAGWNIFRLQFVSERWVPVGSVWGGVSRRSPLKAKPRPQPQGAHGFACVGTRDGPATRDPGGGSFAGRLAAWVYS